MAGFSPSRAGTDMPRHATYTCISPDPLHPAFTEICPDWRPYPGDLDRPALRQIARLLPGESLSVAGGAAPLTFIRREA